MYNANSRRMTPVFILDGEELPPVRQNDWRTAMMIELTRWKEKFFRDNMLLMVFLIGLVIGAAASWAVTSAIVKHNVTQEVTARVTSEMRSGFQNYLDQMDMEARAATFLSGDASRQAQIEADTVIATKAVEGIAAITERPEDIRTYVWNMCFRMSNGSYPNSMEGVVSQANQYMGYSESNPVISWKQDIVKEVITEYYSGVWPATDKYVYAEWDEHGKVILRDTYLADRSTQYWWFGK